MNSYQTAMCRLVQTGAHEIHVRVFVLLQDQAALSYANREFGDAVKVLNELVQRQSDNPRWYEMRAQVHLLHCSPGLLSVHAA